MIWKEKPCTMIEFQSGHPVRGATRPQRPRKALCPNFNPRAPCGARRTEHGEAVIREKFQSTRPVWGATKAAAGDRPRQLISIHAPRVGRDGLHALFVQQGRISIHAPRVGRDAQPGERSWLCADFNPRAPCGARLGPALSLSPSLLISIHAPRVGRDQGREPPRFK